MIKSIRSQKNLIDHRLYLLKKDIPQWFFVMMFLACCFSFVFAMAISLATPYINLIIKMTMISIQQDPLGAILCGVVLLSIYRFPMFLADSGFIFLRVALGYEVRRNSTILKWSFNKIEALMRTKKIIRQRGNTGT